MFYDEDETRFALNELHSVVRRDRRPLVLWIGAGASAWAGYPLWQEVASSMHSAFVREEHRYDRTLAAKLIAEDRYPELFEQMRLANEPKYFSMLVQKFAPRTYGPVYDRLIRGLREFAPLRIVTTNVDESLERCFQIEALQRSDVERLPTLLADGKSFVCKLHGTVSAVESMVFSTADYEQIRDNSGYLGAVRRLFTDSTVLFLGYSLRDEHILNLIREAEIDCPLFGSGPHFIGTSTEPGGLPGTVKRIRYAVSNPQSDHRGALLVVEAIPEWQRQGRASHEQSIGPNVIARVHKSTYFIGDILPSSEWQTSQSMIVSGGDGQRHEMVVGPGYVNGEIVVDGYQSLHDLIVGLVCFDIVLVPIDSIGRLHELLGGDVLWALTDAGAIQVVVPPSEAVTMFIEPGALVGHIGAINLMSSEGRSEGVRPISIAERIAKQISAVPGQERLAEIQLQRLEQSVVDLSGEHSSESFLAMTRGALMHPTIRSMLGISHGTPRGSIPRWLAYPILRLAEVTRRGVICQKLNVDATRLGFGSEKLASVAFSSAPGEEWADSAASYTLTGRFNSNLGLLAHKNPEVVRSILAFRESQHGEVFRREIAERLVSNEGGEVFASMNAGLQKALPYGALQKARDQFSGLFVSGVAGEANNPALFGDLRNADERIRGWRKHSLLRLKQVAAEHKLEAYRPCPCGSGESFKFCCLAALS